MRIPIYYQIEQDQLIEETMKEISTHKRHKERNEAMKKQLVKAKEKKIYIKRATVPLFFFHVKPE